MFGKIILLISCTFVIQFSKAQQIVPKSSFNIELGLPSAMGNKAFRTIMQGLVNVGTYYQRALPNSLAFGIGARYTFFEVNQFKTPEALDGGLHSVGGFVKVSREKFHSDRFGTDMGVKVGYTKNFISTDLNKKMGQNPQSFEATYIEPCIGLILTSDEFTSYRLHIGYAFQGFGFNPTRLGTLMDGGYDASSFGKPTNYLVVGFGYTHYFKPKSI